MLRRSLGDEAVSRFQILAPLGSGGFGAVYEAIDQKSQRRVALKELDNTSADSIVRFKHEFRALADCHHPNLVGLYELIEQDGRWLIVMELVPGTDLIDYVRGRDPGDDGAHHFDEGRLRSAFAGVVEGLKALHGYGILHRDLKPSNVRVRPDGRAVLLDFGLATSTNPKQQSTHGLGVGTVRYMAPEQGTAKPVGPATDLYALGVCLFEALTGRVPFNGSNAVEILLAKSQKEPPRAASLNAAVPADLDELCARLLSLDPAQRPSPDQVLFALGGDMKSLPPPLQPPAPPPEELFAGRERELELLERALAATHDRGELRIVLVEGESGVGKSELVAEFLRRSASSHPNLLALRGRCYENEQVSYKAFDGCVDELARFLQKLPERESAALVPERATLLAQLFPVLKNIDAILRSTRDGLAADPTARRLEAFNALATLFANIAEERPLVLVVDDLQWADSESFRMLQAMVQRPTTPALLLLATVRPREELEADVLGHVNAVRTWTNTDVVPLYGLPRDAAKALAAKLLGARAPDGWLEMIALESGGHPLFLGELVHYTQSRELATRGSVTLEAALRARIDRLERPARELLEFAAIAARPHGGHVFAQALGATSIEEPARALLAAKLLRLRKGQELGCYHDRIRHTASGLIAPARAVALHRRLALALADAKDVDPAEQAHHWDLANDVDRAVDAYELAIERAIDTLAFVRACQLCARAMQLIGDVDDERAQRLRVRYAHALSSAGRSREAAVHFQRASEVASGETRVRLRARAAHQLMMSGKMADGVQGARALLVELGFRVPLSALGSMLSLLWDGLCARISNRFARRVRRDAVVEDPGTRLRFEVLDELMRGLAFAHPVAAFSLMLQHLMAARRAGLAAEAASLLSGHGWLLAMRGQLSRALPLFERSRRELAQCDAPPRLIAQQAYAEGAARIAGLDCVGGKSCLTKAEELAREHAPDRPYFITTIRYLMGVSRFHLGEHALLAREAEPWLAEVRERNDALGEALLVGLGYCFIRHLMRDEPERALAELARVEENISPDPFSFAHLGLFIAATYVHRYRGGAASLRWLESFEPRRRRARIFRAGTGRSLYQLARAQSIVHALSAATGAERVALERQARAAVSGLKIIRSFDRAQKLLLTAQLEALSGRNIAALENARLARAQFAAAGDQGEWHATMLEGLLEPGEAGAEKRARAIAHFREQGWRDPVKAISMMLPALRMLMPAHEAERATQGKLLLGRYEVLESLGSGGFGNVIAVRDVHTGRSVALKQLVRSDGKPLERFKREFRALQHLHHPNLARVDELLEERGRWYMAMELVAGSELLEYVRPEGRCNSERLRSVFRGVVRGLVALHEAGFVHRDVTVANIRVTAEGRAVLLDFGLIARIDDATETSAVGTAEYASPAQLAGQPPSAADDLYALGACMYQCLSGRVPFRGVSPAEVASQRKRGVPLLTLPLELVAIEDCCRRLLSPFAHERPSLDEVFAALNDPHGGTPTYAADRLSEISEELRNGTFAGRERELRALARAFDGVRDEGLTFALVEGESGVGKSALVNEFAERMRERSGSLQVLRGRCYENEQLAYRAFDGAVDNLATLLRMLPDAQCEALLPKKAALLAQLFPVLTSVAAIASASKKGLPADPAAQKRQACECFIELLVNVSAEHDLLLVVDDLQWADGESFALLHALAQQRRSLRLMFVCTVRPEIELDPKIARELESLHALPRVERIALSGLGAADARELAKLLDGRLTEQRIDELVRESKGHPLFLRELIAQEHRRQGASTTVTLDGALRAHIAELPELGQALLALVAIAGRPLPGHVYALALEQNDLPREAIISLLASGLLRRRGASELACYHDRIRSVALAMLSTDRRKQLARKLVTALESARVGEAAERARLWDEAGDAAKAIDAYQQAGERALDGFAFEQAEKSYARALELLSDGDRVGDGDPRKRRLLEQRGHALVRAGRSAEAARCFQAAAEGAEGETRVRLRIWAAQHLIQSAQVHEGLQSASDLLDELKSPLGKSERRVLLQMAYERARIRVQGSKFRRRDRVLSSRERLLLEASYGLSSPVRAVAYLAGSSLMVQYLRRALAAGDPVHTARALAFEALFRTTTSPHVDQGPLLEQSRELAHSVGEPALIAEIELLHGLACIAQSAPAAASRYLQNAHEILQTRCPGQPWLLTTVRVYLGWVWYSVVDMPAVTRHTEAWIEEAIARDDRYAFAALTGFGCGSLRHLLRDQPEAATAELDRAMAPWSSDPRLFSNIHLGAFGARGYGLAYAKPSEALAWIDEGAALRAQTYLMRTRACRDLERWMLLDALFRKVAIASGAERTSLLARADSEIEKLKATRTARYQAEALNFVALAKLARGDREGALGTFREAAVACAPFAERTTFLARYCEGALEGGESGRAKCDVIVEKLRNEGWRDLDRALGLHVPAIQLLK